MEKMHHRYILQFSIMMLALIIITTNQVKAQQGQISHGLTPEQVKQFCRPDNPRLSFVNSTESEICGLPKSTPSTPALNSSGLSSGTSSPFIPRYSRHPRHQGHRPRYQALIGYFFRF